PLETELAALRPTDASTELRQRIGCHIERTPPVSRLRWGLVIAGGLAAACVLVVFYPRPSGGPADASPLGGDAVSSRVTVEDSVPSLLVYRRALAQSPEEFDALLSKHALVAADSNDALVRICAFTRSDSKLQALLGEN